MPRSRRWVLTAIAVVLLSPVLSGTIKPARVSGAEASADARAPVGSVLSARLAALAQQADPGVRLPAAQGHEAGTLPLSAADDGPGSVRRQADGRLLVEVKLSGTPDTAFDGLAAAGAELVATPTGSDTVTVAIADGDLLDLATAPQVRSAREIITPIVGGAGLANAVPVPATANASVAAPAVAPATACTTGAVVSEGDVQLRAAEARATFGVDGSGVKVGVLSDSYDKSPFAVTRASTDVAAGELPGATNPCSTTPVEIQAEYDPSLAYTPTDEGRAMLQIVHDLAPGSPLSFASVFRGEQDMADQIRTMASRGAKVIIDDVSYATEPLYQDGVIAKAINDVTASGVTYLSSAANSNIVIDGKDVASYEATGGFRPTTCPAALRSYGAESCHDFDPGPGVSNGDAITLPANTILQVELGWSEPINGVTTDFDVFAIDRADPSHLAGDNSDSIVSGNSTEWFQYSNTSNTTQTIDLYVTRKAGSMGAPRFKFIFQRPSAPSAVQWNTSQGGDIVGPTTYGHNATLAGGSIAAVRYDDAGQVEEFSSRGPATYCWEPITGTSTPAPALAGGCRDKHLDVAASNGVRTSFFAADVGGAWRFYGTSAATPHVAAIAALQRQLAPCRAPVDVLAALRSSARPVGSFGVGATGSGLVDAVGALRTLERCGPAITVEQHQDVNEGDVVTIDWTPGTTAATASTFVQTGGPVPAAIRADTPTTRRFVAPRARQADVATMMSFAITVTDPALSNPVTVPVTVAVHNSVPTARASAPGAVAVGRYVVLEGSSFDAHEPDVMPVSGVGRAYRWRQIEGPKVDLVPGRDQAFRVVSFKATTPGRYRFGLVVVDHGGTGASSVESEVALEVRPRPEPGTVSGVIRDDLGVPIPDAGVLLVGHGRKGWRAWWTGSGPDGSWSVTGVEDDEELIVAAGKWGYATRFTRNHLDLSEMPSFVGPSSTADLTLPLTARQRQLSGRVVTGAAQAAPGVRVELLDDRGQLGETTTGADGRYTFWGLTPGDRYRVRVADDDDTYTSVFATSDGRGLPAGWTQVPQLYVDLTAGNVSLPATVVYRADELRTLRLTVRDRAGAPVSGVGIWVFASGPTPAIVGVGSSRSDGSLVVTGLRPDTYAIWGQTACDGCPGALQPNQWYDGVVGSWGDFSDRVADVVDLRASDAQVVFTLGP